MAVTKVVKMTAFWHTLCYRSTTSSLCHSTIPLDFISTTLPRRSATWSRWWWRSTHRGYENGPFALYHVCTAPGSDGHWLHSPSASRRRRRRHLSGFVKQVLLDSVITSRPRMTALFDADKQGALAVVECPYLTTTSGMSVPVAEARMSADVRSSRRRGVKRARGGSEEERNIFHHFVSHRLIRHPPVR